MAQDYEQALKWYRLAVAQNEPTATLNLGMLYDKGLGVPLDEKEALRLFLAAANQDLGTTVLATIPHPHYSYV